MHAKAGACVRLCATLRVCLSVSVSVFVSAFVCLRVHSHQTAWLMHPDPCAHTHSQALTIVYTHTNTHTHTQARRSVYFGSEFVAHKKK